MGIYIQRNPKMREVPKLTKLVDKTFKAAELCLEAVFFITILLLVHKYMLCMNSLASWS